MTPSRTADSPTTAQRVALVAVVNGAVKIGADGCREYPRGVSAAALEAAWRRRWWRWPRYYTAEPGDTAVLTPEGRRALR